jgi:AraC-like DNA-binding protein
MSLPDSLFAPDASPVTRSGLSSAQLVLARPDWRLTDIRCEAGPSDHAFEERHEGVTIAAVIEGLFTYRSGNGRSLLHPGSVLLGNHGACFECSHAHGKGDRCLAVNVSPELFEEVAASMTGHCRFAFPTGMLPASQDFLPWFAELEAGIAGGDELVLDHIVPGLLEAILSMLSVTPSRRQRVSARDEGRIGEVLNHIARHADEPLTLASLAAIAGMSRYHFLQVFRAVTGVTPYAYVLALRMRRAALQVATGGQPVSAIAYGCGFGDLSTFNARFRSLFGTHPLGYRAKYARNRATFQPRFTSRSYRA